MLAGAVCFGAGASLGGFASAFVALLAGGMLSWLPLVVRGALFGVVVSITVSSDLALRPRRLPHRTQMIPPTRFKRSLYRGMFLFGVELGLGFRTVLPATAPYVLMAGLVLLGEGMSSAVVAGVGWGLGRSLPLWLRLQGLLREPRRRDEGNDVGGRVEQFEKLLSRSAAAAQRVIVPASAVLVLGHFTGFT